MKKSDWNKIEHFTRSEKWGDPEKMNLMLLIELDRYRDYLKRRMIIHCGTQGKHTPDSQHYHGFAVDLHAEGIPLFDAFIAALRFGFTGIGIYPQKKKKKGDPGWYNPGLHLDKRSAQYRAIWTRINGVYRPVDQEILKYLKAA